MSEPEDYLSEIGSLNDEDLLKTIKAAETEIREDCETSLAKFVAHAFSIVDPNSYIHNWHLDEMALHLESVTDGDESRLLFNIPPGHVKSLMVCVFWPAWVWGPKNMPHIRWLFSSYADSLVIRDSVKCRRLIESPWYQRFWGDRFQLTDDQNAKQKYDNTKLGYRLSTTIGGKATGERADIIVVDDPHNVKEAESTTRRKDVLDWWDEAIPSRVNPDDGVNPRARVIVQQRIHENDLAGHVIDKGTYTHLCFPARYEKEHPHVCEFDRRTEEGELLFPALYPDKKITELERDLGSYAAAGQYQQRPTPRTGGMFNEDDFTYIEAHDVPDGLRWTRYWDFASTDEKKAKDPDYTAGALGAIHQGQLIIKNVRRFRKAPPGVEKEIKQAAKDDGHSTQVVIEQEPGSAGKHVIDGYQRRVLKGFTVRGDRPTGKKEVRADPVSALNEGGNLLLVKGPWNREFVAEACNFPLGRYKDQVDSISGLHKMLFKPGTAKILRIA